MGLRLCNGYTRRISTVIMFYAPEECGGEGGEFLMRGWWNIDPGTCVLVHGEDLEDVNRFWYVFADAPDGTFWAGPFGATVPTDMPFDQCFGTGVGGASSAFQSIGFREIDIGDAEDLTLTFTP